MTFPLPTDTAHVRIESRQYRLLQWDLGEGVPRASFKVGLALFAPWFLLLYLLDASELGSRALVLWIAPPALATWRAMSRDASGRLRLAAWVDQVAWLRRRGRPIVNGDTASPSTPRPLHTAVTFHVTDGEWNPHDEVVRFLPPSIRADFITPPGRQQPDTLPSLLEAHREVA